MGKANPADSGGQSEMGIDCQKISINDAIIDTINYAQMSEDLIAYAKGARFDLIETLAQKMAEFIRQHYPITQLKLSLEKPGAISQAKTVGVVIEREFV